MVTPAGSGAAPSLSRDLVNPSNPRGTMQSSSGSGPLNFILDGSNFANVQDEATRNLLLNMRNAFVQSIARQEQQTRQQQLENEQILEWGAKAYHELKRSHEMTRTENSQLKQEIHNLRMQCLTLSQNQQLQQQRQSVPVYSSPPMFQQQTTNTAAFTAKRQLEFIKSQLLQKQIEVKKLKKELATAEENQEGARQRLRKAQAEIEQRGQEASCATGAGVAFAAGVAATSILTGGLAMIAGGIVGAVSGIATGNIVKNPDSGCCLTQHLHDQVSHYKGVIAEYNRQILELTGKIEKLEQKISYLRAQLSNPYLNNSVRA